MTETATILDENGTETAAPKHYAQVCIETLEELTGGEELSGTFDFEFTGTGKLLVKNGEVLFRMDPTPGCKKNNIVAGQMVLEDGSSISLWQSVSTLIHLPGEKTRYLTPRLGDEAEQKLSEGAELANGMTLEELEHYNDRLKRQLKQKRADAAAAS